MSYESPITLIYNRMHGQIKIQTEDNIIKAVASCGINVDKEELIKALEYDRDQYVKGYEDGKAEAMQWIPCSERLPEESGDYLVTIYLPQHDRRFMSFKNFDGVRFITELVIAWMELPEPYKEGAEK